MDFVILTVPSQFAREVLSSLRPYLEPRATLVLTSKGMVEKGLIISDIALGELADPAICGLYGIMFAHFIAQSKGLSAMCVASPDLALAQAVAQLFAPVSTSTFRVHVSSDLRGVEFGGAMKNVYAMTMGMVDGYYDALCNSGALPPGSGITRHSLLSICMTEFVAFGLAFGARIPTLLGPSGIGDIRASSNDSSRNYRYGRWRVAMELEDRVAAAPALHEGYDTVRSAMELAQQLRIDTPVLRATHEILFESHKVADVFQRLLRSLAINVAPAADEALEQLVLLSTQRPPRVTTLRAGRVRRTAFISYRFSKESEQYMDLLRAICGLHAIEVTTGRDIGPQDAGTTVTTVVQTKIRQADYYVAVFLNDDSDSTWLVEERACAIALGKPMLIFVEDGTPNGKLGKLQPDFPYVRMTRLHFPQIAAEHVAKLCTAG